MYFSLFLLKMGRKVIRSNIKSANAPDGGEPAPTRRTRKKERTRREIYNTAMRLFAENGYDGVTIEDICRNASVAKATFFLHFANKAALLGDFNDEVTQALAERLSDHHGSAEEQLTLLHSAFREAWIQNAPVMQKMLRDFIDQPTNLANAAAVNESIVSLVTEIVRRGQERGELRNGIAPELAGISIVSTWSAIAAWWSEIDASDGDTASLQIIDITLNGLKKRPE
ncbi:MAG: TetR/AcrR family transcriptional regulator [Parvibaculum sp.]